MDNKDDDDVPSLTTPMPSLAELPDQFDRKGGRPMANVNATYTSYVSDTQSPNNINTKSAELDDNHEDMPSLPNPLPIFTELQQAIPQSA